MLVGSAFHLYKITGNLPLVNLACACHCVTNNPAPLATNRHSCTRHRPLLMCTLHISEGPCMHLLVCCPSIGVCLLHARPDYPVDPVMPQTSGYVAGQQLGTLACMW